MTEEQRLTYHQVDAFTETPYQGNPAAVCVVEQPLSAQAMQAVASEMNLSETAFVEAPDPSGARRLPWFTPTTEVPLCGHATLASSHVLRSLGHVPPYHFNSASGSLFVHAEPDGALRLDFPADECTVVEPHDKVLAALGLTETATCLSGTFNYIVRVESPDIVDALTPNFTALGAIDLGDDVMVLSVTAPGGTGSDVPSEDSDQPGCRFTRVRSVGRHRRRPRDRRGPYGAGTLLDRRARTIRVHGPTGPRSPGPPTRPRRG